MRRHRAGHPGPRQVRAAPQEQPTAFAVLQACKVALDRAGIEIPFPHLQLFVEDVREPARRALATLPPLLR